MTLLITLLAAIAATAVWRRRPSGRFSAGMLALIYWGAAIMWTVDEAFVIVSQGIAGRTGDPAGLLDDALLGLSVVALGLIIWLVAAAAKERRA